MDSQSKWVAGLAFEIDGSVQRLPGSADTGVRIKHGQLYPVKMRFDFPQNRWTATIGTNSLPSVPISPANPAVGLSQMNIDWFCGDGLWGDNRLVFDNLKVATFAATRNELRRPIRL